MKKNQKQQRFDFDSPPAKRVVRIIDKSVCTVEKPRLQSQCEKILERLRQGPATNDELCAISRKYTGRISDLRAAGHKITLFSRDRSTGLTVYQLEKEAEP